MFVSVAIWQEQLHFYNFCVAVYNFSKYLEFMYYCVLSCFMEFYIVTFSILHATLSCIVQNV